MIESSAVGTQFHRVYYLGGSSWWNRKYSYTKILVWKVKQTQCTRVTQVVILIENMSCSNRVPGSSILWLSTSEGPVDPRSISEV